MYLSYGRSHTQTRKLFLIRHSVPKIDTAVDPSLWGLSETGRQRSTRVAGHLISSSALRSSGERKAVETAGIIGAGLGLIPSTDNALNEHHRQSVGWLKPEEFDEGIALFFGMPKRRVFGDETADEAQAF